MAFGRSSFNSSSKKRRRRSSSDKLPFVIGGAVFVFCTLLLLVFLHFSSSPTDAAVAPKVELPQKQLAEIIVPLETVQVGSSLQPSMFRVDRRPEEHVTGDMVRSYDELKGLYAKGVLIKNQPIIKAALTNRQPIHVLTAMLPKNYRAIALQVEKPLIDNVDGWAQPGTDVDVVWVTNIFGKEVASILAGPVRVLAANKATEWTPAKKGSGSDKLATVTLLLSTRDAIRVTLAAMHGKITLGLRGLDDDRPNEAIRPITSVVDEPLPAQQTKKTHTVKVIDPNSHAAEVRSYDATGRRLDQ
jgi:Flp pilus assembly protein CpaB